MAENTFSDILSVNVDSNETRFYNLSAAETLTVGPNNEISFNANQSTIPGTLNTTASYAITASYARTASYSKTLGASLLNDEGGGNARLALLASDGTYISQISYLTSSLAITASFINGGTF
jgi:hypothetical protein